MSQVEIPEIRPASESPFFDSNLARHATGIEWLILESDNRVSPGVELQDTYSARLISKAIRERGQAVDTSIQQLPVDPLRVHSSRSLPLYTSPSPRSLHISQVLIHLTSSLSTLPRSSGTNVTPDNMTLIRFYGKTYDAFDNSLFQHCIRSLAVLLLPLLLVYI